MTHRIVTGNFRDLELRAMLCAWAGDDVLRKIMADVCNDMIRRADGDMNAVIKQLAKPARRRWFIYLRTISAREWQIGRVWINVPYWKFLRAGCRPFVRWEDKC